MHIPTFRTHHFPALLISSVALTSPAQAQVVDQDMKFLPTTFAPGNQFGIAIDNDNGVIGVGVNGDDINGQLSGSASLFDATTGNLLMQLVPTDGATDDQFGISIAINNGIAIVGAFKDDDNGADSGSAYIFDADPLSPTFGNQLLKLVPPFGAAADWFGWAVAIDNGIAVVGAVGNDGIASNAGSVSFFDVDPLSPSFGTHLFDRHPSSLNPAGDEFGGAISINNGIVAIGAGSDDTNGFFSGTVYLFDTAGNELANLYASNAAASHVFGNSVSIDNGIVAIGARGNNSAYLFDADPLSPDFANQLVELLPSAGAPSDQFGFSISIDNGIVAVGARLNDDNATDAGSAYLFDTDPLAPGYGSPFATILPNTGAANDWFGSAITIDNGIVAVGAYRDDDFGTNSGSAFTFDTSGTQQNQLTPSSNFDEFGWSIATDNGIVAVGVWGDDTNGNNAGAAYLFDECTGNLLVKILPTGGMADDVFGSSIALANGFLVVGAWGDDTNGLNAGAAYIFDADPNSPDFGNQLTKLLPAVGMTTDYFGTSVAIDKNSTIGVDAIAVGAWGDDTNGNNAGAAYIFDVFGNQYAKLIPSGSLADDNFGNVISIDNGLVAVGAWGDDTNGNASGAAYLFDAGGLEIAKLLPSAGAPNYYFGSSIAIDNGIIAVGEYFNATNGPFAGAAYLFDNSGAQIAMLLPLTGAAFDSFGISISIDNDMVVVGANHADGNAPDSGAAYMFHANPALPNLGTQFAQLLPTDGQSNDDFGRSVSISSGSIAVGAIWDDDTGLDNGSAYAFIPCPADFSGDWIYDFFDVSAFLIEFGAGSPRADLNCDGSFDFFDVSKFLSEFAAGCP